MNGLYVINVGNGNSLLYYDQQKTLLLDAGRGPACSRFLRQNQVKHLDYVLLSHADADHVGGLVGLLSSGEVSIGRLYVNSDANKKSELWLDLLFAIDDADSSGDVVFEPALTPHVNEALHFEIGSVKVISPSAAIAARGPGSTDFEGNPLTSNSMSVVVLFNLTEEHSVLAPGDIDYVGLLELRRNSARFSTDALIFPHHGGKPGTSASIGVFVKELLEFCSPSNIIFSVRSGAPDFPADEVVVEMWRNLPDLKCFSTGASPVLASYSATVDGGRKCVNGSGDIKVTVEANALNVK